MIMAEALKLKVDINVFKDTLEQLQTVLNNLTSQKDELQRQVNRMQGETFSGSDVQGAIDLAKEAIDRVGKAIVKVTAQRTAIERYLTGVQTEASTLQSDVNTIKSELPDLFA